MPIKTSIETEEVRYKTAKSIREYQETIEIYKTPNQISELQSNLINIKTKIRIKIQRKKIPNQSKITKTHIERKMPQMKSSKTLSRTLKTNRNI